MKRLIFTSVIVCFFIGQVSALELWLEPAGTHRTGIFDDKGAQILDYHAATNRIFITNPGDQAIDIVSIQDVDNPELLLQLPLEGAPLSVAVHPTYEMIAVAIEGEEVTDNGSVGFYTMSSILNFWRVKNQQEMFTFNSVWGWPSVTLLPVSTDGPERYACFLISELLFCTCFYLQHIFKAAIKSYIYLPPLSSLCSVPQRITCLAKKQHSILRNTIYPMKKAKHQTKR